MAEIMEALCNSIIVILTAISQFDITQINTQNLALVAQLIADSARLVYWITEMLIVVIGR